MENILCLNGSTPFLESKGRLNNTLHDLAMQTLKDLGYNLEQTLINQGYDIKEEIEKILRADALIWQMPGWWMGEPWTVKKYIDEVFTNGHRRFYESDGRSRHDPRKYYGTGGLLQGKKYMFSLTWNAPIEAFTDKNQFFGGIGVDGVYLHLHKAHEFLGMRALPTFIVNDIIKNPQGESYLKDYSAHLKQIFHK
ncbi:NAD(P)H-dependent oxidoreductase [Helicobacter suis]|uniref:NAD(P)H-dependent oxidoreductase n=1 Tax=Helicobacter suis TaxID=104628 RepID=UPI0013D8A192|nr:NAD(P)H-dependent oxidoreductase [Helicobacter suis]